jgi:hypothetical protein
MIYQSNKKNHLSKFADKTSDITVLQQINVNKYETEKEIFRSGKYQNDHVSTIYYL